MSSSQSNNEFGRVMNSWQPRRCDNPWKPNMQTGQSEVYRRMLGILNRVTEQSMPVLLQQALELPITHPEHLPSILSLILTKSQDEPLFTPTYAQFCSELSRRLEIEAPLSRACDAHFLDSLQRLFQFELDFQGVLSMDAIQQEILARKRLTVHISFVCALEKKGLVPMEQLISMTEVLLSHGDLRSIECLCRLLSFAGAKLASEREDVVERCCSELENHLNNASLPPRLKYLLQDTIELKDNGWRPPVRRPNQVTRNVRG